MFKYLGAVIPDEKPHDPFMKCIGNSRGHKNETNLGR